MRGLSHVVLAVAGAMLVVPAGAHGPGQEIGADPAAAMAFSQAAIGREVGDYAFLDTERRIVRLADYRGRALVVNLIYTSCSQACPIIVDSVYRAVELGHEALGPDSFSVITVGFDAAADTPDRMRAFASAHGIELPNWAFLSADRATAHRLADDLGFVYYESAKGFDHLSQTTIVGPDGRVAAQVYGEQFEERRLVDPLRGLALGRASNFTSLAGLMEGVRLFCTIYDPASGRYRFDYSIFVGSLVGALSLGAVAVVLVRGVLADRRRRRA